MARVIQGCYISVILGMFQYPVFDKETAVKYEAVILMN